MIIIYDHTWWSCTAIIYDDHLIRSPYMIIYDVHIWSSYRMIIYKDYQPKRYKIISRLIFNRCQQFLQWIRCNCDPESIIGVQAHDCQLTTVTTARLTTATSSRPRLEPSPPRLTTTTAASPLIIIPAWSTGGFATPCTFRTPKPPQRGLRGQESSS